MAQGVADSDEARAAAGRTGPGQLVGEAMGRGERDSLPRMDTELLAAGITPGDPSLYTSPDPSDLAADRGTTTGTTTTTTTRTTTTTTTSRPRHDHHDHSRPPARPRAQLALRALRRVPVSPTTLALVLGLPMAVVAALRATWSP